VARRSRARNRGSAPDLAPPGFRAYTPLPVTGFPFSFEFTVHHLREASGRFVTSGYLAYGALMRQFAQATVDAWLALDQDSGCAKTSRR